MAWFIVVVRCPRGDLMPARAAADWLADRGYEVAAAPWVLRRLRGE